ncbi:hypothetical protein QX183_05310 [Malacoplasma iowae]|nr:hypothetical protein QX183_05310 [Malacoplasma iowae]
MKQLKNKKLKLVKILTLTAASAPLVFTLASCSLLNTKQRYNKMSYNS